MRRKSLTRSSSVPYGGMNLSSLRKSVPRVTISDFSALSIDSGDMMIISDEAFESEMSDFDASHYVTLDDCKKLQHSRLHKVKSSTDFDVWSYTNTTVTSCDEMSDCDLVETEIMEHQIISNKTKKVGKLKINIFF